MGLINVVKLANDYNKAKKLLKKNGKIDASKIKELIEKLHDFIEELKDIQLKISEFILKVKSIMKSLSDKLERLERK